MVGAPTSGTILENIMITLDGSIDMEPIDLSRPPK
jgi:hypothetical protein